MSWFGADREVVGTAGDALYRGPRAEAGDLKNSPRRYYRVRVMTIEQRARSARSPPNLLLAIAWRVCALSREAAQRSR